MFHRLYKNIRGFGWDKHLNIAIKNRLKGRRLSVYYIPIYFEFEELKKEITPDVVREVKNQRAIFLFDYTGEGCDGAIWTIGLLHQLYELGLEEKDLKKSTLLTSNMGDEIFWDLDCSVFSKFWPGRHIGIDIYMWGKGWRSGHYSAFSSHKPYKFICLNNSDKKHKNIVIDHLDKNGYSERGIVTYLSKGRTSFVDDGNLEDMDKFQSKFYEQAAFSIRNTALFYEQDSIFFCEKLLQDINGRVPFIAISTPYTLEYLRQKGYKTFPELFDESYDVILNHTDRMNFILKEIDKVMNMSEDELYTKIYNMRYKLEYNYERLQSYIEYMNRDENHNRKVQGIVDKVIQNAYT